MPKVSAYFAFIRYYRDSERRKGRNLTIDQAKAEADPTWEKFDATSRAYFEEMAEAEATFRPHRRPRPPPPVMSVYREKMRGYIETALKTVADVRTHPFHFVSYHKGSSCKRPSELSVLRFSIERGADHFMHYIFNPEVSPSQFKLRCEAAGAKLTVVPIEGTPNSQQNLAEVWSSIYNFTGGTVYTMSNDTQMAIQCFLELKAACPGPEKRDIIPLDGEELIQMLWERSPDAYNAQFSHVRETCANQSGLDCLACDFHRVSRNTGICSLWKPYRLAYGLTTILTEPYDIRVSEGYHRLRENWKPVGTYFNGKGDYEDWFYEGASSGWNSGSSSSSSQAWGGNSASNWG